MQNDSDTQLGGHMQVGLFLHQREVVSKDAESQLKLTDMEMADAGVPCH